MSKKNRKRNHKPNINNINNPNNKNKPINVNKTIPANVHKYSVDDILAEYNDEHNNSLNINIDEDSSDTDLIQAVQDNIDESLSADESFESAELLFDIDDSINDDFVDETELAVSENVDFAEIELILAEIAEKSGKLKAEFSEIAEMADANNVSEFIFGKIDKVKRINETLSEISREIEKINSSSKQITVKEKETKNDLEVTFGNSDISSFDGEEISELDRFDADSFGQLENLGAIETSDILIDDKDNSDNENNENPFIPEEMPEIISLDDDSVIDDEISVNEIKSDIDDLDTDENESNFNEMNFIGLTENESKNKKSFWAGIFPVKGDGISEIIRKLVFLCAFTVFVGAGVMLASTLMQSKKAVDDLSKIKDIVTTTVATTVDSEGNIVTVAPTQEEIIEHNFNIMEYYHDINEDVISFIELEGCDIFQPVVQGDDNDYYLNHTYYDTINKAGAVFMDHRCTFTEDYTSPNIVLYGHNQEDGTMFGNLKEYKNNVEFYAENPVVKLRKWDGINEYLIYGYFVTNTLAKQDSNGEVFNYHDYIETLKVEGTFNWYMRMVYERNQIISPVDVKYGDELLVLSTCSNEFSNSRFVVFARKLRDNEKITDFDFTSAQINHGARSYDWEAIMSGETTVYRTEITEESSETTVPEDSDETTVKSKKTKSTSVDESDSDLNETTSKTKKTTVADGDVSDETTESVKSIKKTAASTEVPQNSDGSVSDSTSSKKSTKTTKNTDEVSSDEVTSSSKKSTSKTTVSQNEETTKAVKKTTAAEIAEKDSITKNTEKSTAKTTNKTSADAETTTKNTNKTTSSETEKTLAVKTTQKTTKTSGVTSEPVTTSVPDSKAIKPEDTTVTAGS